MPFARISGIGSYLPERVLTNADLERMVDTSDEWITTRTGISERRIAAEGEATSDLAARALEAAVADAGLAPSDMDLLIVATSSPDMLFPSTSCLAQAKTGMTCPAYDVNAACTGFIYALHAACSAIESGRARRVAVAGADAFSRLVDFTDRSTCVLFGDGAGAVILEASEEPGISSIVLGADGSGADVLKVPAGGSAIPTTAATCEARQQFVSMNGNEVFKFAVRAIPKATREALRQAGLATADVRWFVPHQANQRILDTVADRLHVEHERVYSNIAAVGNTSTASIPLALDELYTGGDLQPGDRVLLVGFGAGLTWGATVATWTKEVR